MALQRVSSFLIGLLGILSCATLAVQGAPTLEATPLEPLLAVAGDAVLIDCVVKNLENYTIIWRRAVPGSNKTEILSAGEVRIIPDNRFSLLHQKGHDTWVLQIQKAQVNDSGRYICEVNTNPRMQIFRMLSVVERIQANSKAFPVDHNYTGCCVEHNVPTNCREFCSLQSVIMGGHPNPWQCMEHLPVITRCLTDGRNHMPCCVKQNIPEVCRSVCSGDYGLTTVRQHYSCMDFTIPTLSCIAEGIELLPGPAEEVTVESLSWSELRVKWSPPRQEPPVENYLLNVTLVRELSDLQQLEAGTVEQKKPTKSPGSKRPEWSLKSFMAVLVPGNQTSYVASGLRPLTMYEVRLTSKNSFGSSMPTPAVRALTLAEPDDDPAARPDNATEVGAHLPNITQCCQDKGVPEGRCLRSLCDPADDEDTKLSDVIMCAPFVNVTFECMSGGADHSRCCRQRGLPEVCLDFCRGNVTHLDHRHFVCLDHIDIYGNCLLEYYKVLPGPPEDFLVSVVNSQWAVLKWKPPSFLAQTVLSYVLYWKEVAMDEIIEYNIVNDVKSPHLLDNLQPKTRYEVYVSARNSYGLSRGSARAVFTTPPSPEPLLQSLQQLPAYNETSCCLSAGLKKGCLDLCTYNMKMSDLQLLAVPCADQLEILVRCGAGGRDHAPCCQRRGIRWECLPICSALIEMSPQAIVSTCISDAGKIIQCMAEGVGTIPEAPEELHAGSILPTRIHLNWKFHNTTDAPVWFEVRYTESEGEVPPHPLDYAYAENTSETNFALKNLKEDTFYCVYVVALNEHGSSLPSLVLLVHTPERDDIYNETIEATLGPPHSLEVTQQTTDSVSLSWRPPFHVPANSSLSYLVTFRPVNASSSPPTVQSTVLNSATLDGLTVNTQYAVSVRARTSSPLLESPASETVLAWTDPAIPAFLNPPVVVPPEPPVEGSNVTLLCVATGMPVPVVSLFVNGELRVRQQQSHVALVLPDIRRDVSRVDCFADNGLGQGAQSSAHIQVSFPPQVESLDKRIPAEEGSVATVRCLVSGHPEPRVLWYRDRKLREPITRGKEYDLNMKPYKEKVSSYMATLTITQVSTVHEGQYFCYAENHLGKDTVFVNLDVLPKLYTNASACCEEKGVSDECQEACNIDIDIQMALNKPKCFKDLDKLMYCAADGSDHRKCCRDNGIQRSCLRWCQGRPIINTHLCILHASKIVSCFEEGKAVLPGPPQNIQYHMRGDKDLEITWDIPQKNPKVVQWYKIFWRPVGSRLMFRNHTKQRSISLHDLEPGTTYEVVVKAGNHYGISLHSQPLTFTIRDVGGSGSYYAESAYGSSPVAKTAAAVIGTALFLVLVGGLGIFFYQRQRLMKPPPGITPGVSFENPTYMKDNLPQQNNSGAGGQPNGGEQPNGESKRETQT